MIHAIDELQARLLLLVDAHPLRCGAAALSLAAVCAAAGVLLMAGERR